MAYSDDVLRYNSYGKEYEVARRRVFCLSELQRGDHIAFDRFQGIYCHHAIVKHVDQESGEIKTIEYNCTPSGKFQVMEKTNRFLQEVPVYLMLYGSFDRDLVLWKAQSKIGEEKYNVFTNNCEHFAMWCITGRSSCDQMTQSMAQNGLTTMASDAGTGARGILAGGALAVAFEGLSMAYDIGKVQGDLETGRIDQKAYYKTVQKRVVTGASRVAGSTIGMAVGQAFIPVPAVGAAIGGVLGALVGRFLGNLTENIVYDNDCEDDVDYYEAEDT